MLLVILAVDTCASQAKECFFWGGCLPVVTKAVSSLVFKLWTDKCWNSIVVWQYSGLEQKGLGAGNL